MLDSQFYHVVNVIHLLFSQGAKFKTTLTVKTDNETPDQLIDTLHLVSLM